MIIIISDLRPGPDPFCRGVVFLPYVCQRSSIDNDSLENPGWFFLFFIVGQTAVVTPRPPYSSAIDDVFLLQSPTGDNWPIITCWAPRCKVVCSPGRPKLGLRLPGEITIAHHVHSNLWPSSFNQKLSTPDHFAFRVIELRKECVIFFHNHIIQFSCLIRPRIESWLKDYLATLVHSAP
jgi:hypothetical protein